jgi:hypothetical protein
VESELGFVRFPFFSSSEDEWLIMGPAGVWAHIGLI